MKGRTIMIQIENICKSFSNGKENVIQALSDVSLTVNDVEMISVTGPSGSGKSTLLHIIAMLDTQDSGKYFYNGIDVSAMSESKKAQIRNREIGIVLQDYGLIGEMNALKNVALPLTIAGETGKAATQRAKDALCAVGLSDKLKQKANLLSGGQRQRVAIARAIVMNANVILADEPTGAVDSKTTNDIMDLFSSINLKTGASIIIVTHDLAAAERCGRKVKIEDGTIS